MLILLKTISIFLWITIIMILIIKPGINAPNKYNIVTVDITKQDDLEMKVRKTVSKLKKKTFYL